ncbi:MAG: DUF1573 domain-containing protein [Planctomyces sp.]|nr:DUF1573 domain-containing protein [Planctomyces sp.]
MAARIAEVKASCGCTLIDGFAAGELAPGDSMPLKIAINPMAYGTKESLISIFTSGSTTAALVIPVKAIGPPLRPPYLKLAPDQLELRICPEDGLAESEFSVTCVEAEADDPWLTGVECSIPALTLSEPAVESELRLDDSTVARTYRFSAAIGESNGDEFNRTGFLTFKHRTPSMRPVRTVLVRLTQDRPVQCVPESIVARRVDHPHRIVIRSSDDVEFQLTSIACGENGVRFRYDPDRLAQTHVLEAVFDDSARNCAVECVLTHPKQARVSFSVVTAFND